MNLSRTILSLIFITLFPACTSIQYYPITQRYNVITLAEIPVSEKIKHRSSVKQLAKQNAFFSDTVEHSKLTIMALQETSGPNTYVEGHYRSLHIPILFFQRAFYGNEVELRQKPKEDGGK